MIKFGVEDRDALIQNVYVSKTLFNGKEPKSVTITVTPNY